MQANLNYSQPMNLSIFRYLLILCVLMAGASPAMAATRYISDEVKVNMRKGQGTDFAISAILSTDDKVEVLNNYEKTGYSRVRTESGKVGYILTRFLTEVPPAAERLASLTGKVAELEAENARLKQSLEESRGEFQTATSQQSELGQENEALKKRLAWIEETSANVVKIGDENQQMRERLLALEAEVSRLQQQNTELKTWYKGQNSGALILGAGLLVGLIVGRLRRRSGAWSSDRI